MKSAIVAAVLTLASAGSAAAQGLEVRFCPDKVARTYPLDHTRGVQGLLLQNVAVINRTGAPVTLSAVEIDLMRGADAVDTRRVTGAALDNAAKGGAGVQGSGMMEVIGFQFCDGALLNKATLSPTTTLAPGQGLMLMHQTFAWRGARDTVRVRAVAAGANGEGAVAIDGSTSKTQFRWPLGPGKWLVFAGASFHSTHRWGVPEAFALDIAATGPEGLTHHGAGEANTDFYAYGATVLAAADGTVVKVLPFADEPAPMLRHDGESMEDYLGRVSAEQNKRLALGAEALGGETISIDHGGGEFSIYGHLQPGSATVKPGQKVSAGQPIARLGSSGNSTEPHLHFQVCDAPGPLSCSAIVPTFTGIEMPLSDGPRPLQSGDVVMVR
jgi:hypothetical protein